MNGWIWAMIAIACNVMAQAAMKMAGQFMQQHSGWQAWLSPWLLVAVLSYGASFLLTVKVFSQNALSVAGPFMAGASFLLVALVGALIFNESFNLNKIIALTLILLGIVLLSFKA